MWGAISRMGDEFWELATREDSSESVDEGQGDGPEVLHEEVPEAPCTVTNPIPLFGILPNVYAVSFGTFDDASIRDSFSFTVLK